MAVGKKDQSVDPRGKMILVAQEIQFAKILAGNDKKLRDRGVKKLKKWLTVRSRSSYQFTDEDFMRIWKGLFYCMWMSDKLLVQEELAETISKLIHCFNRNTSLAVLFMSCFFRTMIAEWFGIDIFRYDKFMMLVRRFLRQTFEFCYNSNWDADVVLEVCDGFSKTILSGSSSVSKPHPVSLLMHFCEIYPQELAKVGRGKIPKETVTTFLQPFIRYLAVQEDGRVRKQVFSEVFRYLMKQSDAAFEFEEKFSAWKAAGCPGESWRDMEKVEEDDEDNGNAGSDADILEDGPLDPRAGHVDVQLPTISFDGQDIADKMEKESETCNNKKYRKSLQKLARRFRNLAEGEYPLAEAEVKKQTKSKVQKFKLRDRLIHKVACQLNTFEARQNKKGKKKRKKHQQMIHNGEPEGSNDEVEVENQLENGDLCDVTALETTEDTDESRQNKKRRKRRKKRQQIIHNVASIDEVEVENEMENENLCDTTALETLEDTDDSRQNKKGKKKRKKHPKLIHNGEPEETVTSSEEVEVESEIENGNFSDAAALDLESLETMEDTDEAQNSESPGESSTQTKKAKKCKVKTSGNVKERASHMKRKCGLLLSDLEEMDVTLPQLKVRKKSDPDTKNVSDVETNLPSEVEEEQVDVTSSLEFCPLIVEVKGSVSRKTKNKTLQRNAETSEVEIEEIPIPKRMGLSATKLKNRKIHRFVPSGSSEVENGEINESSPQTRIAEETDATLSQLDFSPLIVKVKGSTSRKMKTKTLPRNDVLVESSDEKNEEIDETSPHTKIMKLGATKLKTKKIQSPLSTSSEVKNEEINTSSPKTKVTEKTDVTSSQLNFSPLTVKVIGGSPRKMEMSMQTSNLSNVSPASSEVENTEIDISSPQTKITEPSATTRKTKKNLDSSEFEIEEIDATPQIETDISSSQLQFSPMIEKVKESSSMKTKMQRRSESNESPEVENEEINLTSSQTKVMELSTTELETKDVERPVPLGSNEIENEDISTTSPETKMTVRATRLKTKKMQRHISLESSEVNEDVSSTSPQAEVMETSATTLEIQEHVPSDEEAVHVALPQLKEMLLLDSPNKPRTRSMQRRLSSRLNPESAWKVDIVTSPQPKTPRKFRPSSGKKVNIVLNKNGSQDVRDYHISVKRSPAIPFDANKKPVQGVLKPSAVYNRTNPFYRLKRGKKI